MPNAKITSKGQVTIPAEVREALGLKKGDTLAFEVQAEYVVVRKRLTLAEVLEKSKDLLPTGRRLYATKDEAVAEYFANLEPDDLADEPFVVGPKRLRKGHS
ncbi:MAG: AbrB/MazE/SpoVT family DNA-binding domain-containing protein [Coriobacteriia bacterium]|nr:AbrB/MazE/SpoVT family DNA-binding domain-containing protein [Coriobacteriia bacterium]